MIFAIISSKSYASELQDSNKTSYNSPDFYPQYKKTSISINGFKVLLALASTDEQRIKGLLHSNNAMTIRNLNSILTDVRVNAIMGLTR